MHWEFASKRRKYYLLLSLVIGDTDVSGNVDFFFRSQAHIDVTLEITSHGNGDVSHLVHSSQQVGVC